VTEQQHQSYGNTGRATRSYIVTLTDGRQFHASHQSTYPVVDVAGCAHCERQWAGRTELDITAALSGGRLEQAFVQAGNALQTAFEQAVAC
jgi:hypothetical protein